MRRKIAILVALACAFSLIHGFASADRTGRPREGDVLGKKYALLEAVGDNHDLCHEVRDWLNQPTIYDPNDLAASLLATDAAMMWQVMDRVTRNPRPFRTVGEFRDQEDRADYLELDLNGDGTSDRIVREWLTIKGQIYTAVFVGADRRFEPITYETLRTALGKAYEEYLDSSFFLLEILVLDQSPFVIALATVNTGAEWPDRFAYLVHMNAAMQPEVDCILKTIVFGD